MEDQIREVISRYIQPLIEGDGGTIEIIEINEAEVIVRLGGTCAGCPGRPYTIEQIIRPALYKGVGRPISVIATV